MKKIVKKFISVIMVMSFLVTSVFSAGAYAANDSIEELNIEPVVGVYNDSPVAPTSGSTYLLGTRTALGCKYYIYRYYGNWYAIFGNLDLCMPCYKGSAATSITQTMSKTYSSQTAYEFSTSMGGNATIDVLEITRSVTGGVSRTTEVSFDLEYSISFNLEKDDKVGYYKIGVCHDIYRHEVLGYMEDDILIAKCDMSTPNGVAYYALLYSTSSGSGYAKY